MVSVENKELRQVYTELLIEAAEKDERIVLMDADLMAASKAVPFRDTYPERTVDVGVAEANMISIAAGLAASGKIPFTHTFTPFATRRAFDQVTISVAYSKLPVKMMGSDPGVTAELNGGTHMSFEDVALMRSLPEMLIFEPVDGYQMREALPHLLAHKGPVYIRLFRKTKETLFNEDYKMNWLKGDTLEEGTDVSIIASGIMVKEALEAAKTLKAEGISARVINIHTVKPIDRDIIVKAAKETGAIVTAENHNIIGALGSAVAEVLVEECPVPMERIGVKDHFGEVGKMPFLMEKYGMLAKDIVEAAKKTVARK